MNEGCFKLGATIQPHTFVAAVRRTDVGDPYTWLKVDRGPGAGHQAEKPRGRAGLWPSATLRGDRLGPGQGIFCRAGDLSAGERRCAARTTSGRSHVLRYSLESVKPDEVKIVRARFPGLTRSYHREDTIGSTTPRLSARQAIPLSIARPAPSSSSGERRHTYAEDAFAAQPRTFKKPDELARHVIEMLFAPAVDSIQ